MRQRPKALGFAILLAPLAALHVGSPAQAASVALKCRRACHDRIAGCVAAGGRRGLSWFDVVSCTETRSWALPIAADYGIGSGEGNPSNDGRFVLIGGTRQIYV